MVDRETSVENRGETEIFISSVSDGERAGTLTRRIMRCPGRKANILRRLHPWSKRKRRYNAGAFFRILKSNYSLRAQMHEM